MINKLPPINFAEKSTDKIIQEMINLYEATTKRTLAPGDPVRLFLYSIALLIVSQRTLIDFSAKQNLLAYAQKEYLDYIGDFLGVERLPAAAAKTTLKFTIAAAQSHVVLIPAGTRAAGFNNIFFATIKTAEIPAGQIFVEVIAECTVTGKEGNGFLIGQINQIVDPFPFFKEVTNTTKTEGGSDIEDDELFRDRIRQAPQSFSVAGPTGAYEFWAKSTHPQISDVSVRSPKPGEVEIRPLLAGGQLPSDEILAAVYAKCNDKTIRPLTDLVSVLSPEAVYFDVNIEYWISIKNIAIAADIQKRVTAAVTDYVNWQKAELGRYINPSELMKDVIDAGAKRAFINSPLFKELKHWEVALAKEPIAIIYRGLEDG